MKKNLLFVLFLYSSGIFMAQNCLRPYQPGESLPLNWKDQVTVPQLKRDYKFINPISPRFQWNANGGYCGEVSMISAGLLYGQFFSQFDMRNYANPGKNGVQTKDYQLLLGINDNTAAQALHFKYECLQSNSNADFWAWVKHHVALGHPVIIGVFNNEYLLYSSTDSTKGQHQYDHIVPVIGFYSNEQLWAPSNESDVILFSDNGLYTPLDNDNIAYCHPPSTSPKADSVPYLYHIPYSEAFKTRVQANDSTGIPYSILKLPKESYANYGIAITGYLGDEYTNPVSLTVNYNFEYPCIEDGQSDRPKAMDIEFKLRACELIPGKKYQIFLYHSMEEVPIGKIEPDNKYLWKSFTAKDSVFELDHIPGSTEKQYIFRVIEVE